MSYRTDSLDQAKARNLSRRSTGDQQDRAPVPAGTSVAWKAGEISGVQTEWALVELPGRPYAVALMVKLAAPEAPSAPLESAARIVQEYFFRLSRSTKYGTYGPAPGK